MFKKIAKIDYVCNNNSEVKMNKCIHIINLYIFTSPYIYIQIVLNWENMCLLYILRQVTYKVSYYIYYYFLF